ncbi:DUF551 domain-containing protein [Escherichia coli]|nr:DUF551 domain-containing protein [Escherichia coli]MED0285180.1 DUF551 domain-containing protein [Escherichia coli]MED9367490.1 DUF551 domain-containing protein [Escherichia coli]
MTTITDKKQYPGEQYLNELITNIEFAARAPVEVVRAMAAELQKRREADSAEPVAYIFKHPAGKLFWALTDESNKEQADVIPVYAAPPVPVVPEEKPMPNALSMLEREITQLIGDAQEATVTGYELIAEAWRLMDGQDPKTSDWHSKASKYLNSNIVEKVDDDRIEAVKAVLRRLAGNYPVIPDGWISCSERMPNDAQWCVVNTEYGYYVQCWSEGQGWLGDDISIPECDVINWMPLPEPPKEAK